MRKTVGHFCLEQQQVDSLLTTAGDVCCGCETAVAARDDELIIADNSFYPSLGAHLVFQLGILTNQSFP
jgi:hypothetical protein